VLWIAPSGGNSSTRIDMKLFRLETLSVYQWQRKAEYETFLATGILAFRTMTLADSGSSFSTNRSMGRRVHVIRRPLTDYLRYNLLVMMLGGVWRGRAHPGSDGPP